MSDALLSVEVVTKLDALSAGLKKGEKDIKNFVDSSMPSLANLENMLKGLGIDTAKAGAKAIATATRAVKEKTAADKEQLAAQKRLAEETNKKVRETRDFKVELEAQSKFLSSTIRMEAAINAERVARVRLNAEAAKQAIANNQLIPKTNSQQPTAASTAAAKGNLGLIEKLKTQLAGLKDASTKAMSVTAIEKYNASMQSVEKEIKRLTNIGKLGFDDLGNAITKSYERPVGALNRLVALQDIYKKGVVGMTNPDAIAKYNQKLEDTKQAIERLNNVGKKGFDSAGNKDPFETAKARQATAEIKNYVREQSNAKGSIEQRRAALIRLLTTYDRLSVAERNSTYGNRMATVIKDLTAQVQKLEFATGRGQRNVGQYGSAFDQLKDRVTTAAAGLLAFYASYNTLKTIFDENVHLSDNFVDVQRTAKLSADEVDNLGKSLKAINTRTNLEGLLDIGFEGGRLGVQKEELLDFIKTVDQLAVVLKKELPGGAEALSESLGKIAKIYQITESEGISLGAAMNKLGSSFLDLAHSGPITVKYLQDFTLGVAGTAVSAKMSLPQIEAYGAVMQTAGIIASSASISMTRLVNDLSSKREKYFAIAQLEDSTLTLEKFTNLINTDTKSALDLFLKGLKAGNPSQVEFTERIKSVGITTGKVSNAVKVLANNFDLLEGKTAIASKGYEEATSISHNFELANNSLAASLDKIKNATINAFADSAAQRSLAALLNAVTDNRTAAERLASEYAENKHQADELNAALNPLLKKYDDLKSKANLNATEQEELRDVTSKIGELLPGVTTKFDDYGNAIDINRRKVRELSKAQMEYLELQNRSAIKVANAQFDQAQKYLPDAKQKAAAPKKTNGVYNSVYDFLYGGDREKDVEVASKDRITRLAANAYAAAKAVRDLGGTLTAAQKKVIDYYEAVEQSKKPVKKDVLITGDGTYEDTQTDLGRTTEDIKQEIKDLESANKKLAVSSAQFKTNVGKIKALKKELKEANGGTVAVPRDVFASVETQLADFQNKSNIITKEGLAKDLQEWEDKYKKIKAIIQKLPAGPRKARETQTLETNYREGKVNILAANSREIAAAIKKRNNEIALLEMDGSAREIEQIKSNYDEQIRLAEGNKDAVTALRKQQADEISNVQKAQAAKDVNVIAAQVAEIAKEYRQHQADMFDLAQTDGYAAVEVAENQKAKADLRKLYDDKLIDFADYQANMKALIEQGNKLKVRGPVLDATHFQNKMNEVREAIGAFKADVIDQGIAETLGGMSSAIGEALATGGNVIGAVGGALIKSLSGFLGEYGRLLIAYGAAAILKSKLDAAALVPGGGLIAGPAAIAAGIALQVAASAINSFASGGSSRVGSPGASKAQYGIPQFANGGIVSGPTLAMVGEYPGAKSDPEVISPLSKLKTLIGDRGNGQGQVFIAETRISGQDLVTSFRRAQRNSGRTS